MEHGYLTIITDPKIVTIGITIDSAKKCRKKKKSCDNQFGIKKLPISPFPLYMGLHSLVLK